jgi:hypothetical protein
VSVLGKVDIVAFEEAGIRRRRAFADDSAVRRHRDRVAAE